MRKCKICKCQKTADQLDSRGRCQGCADAKTATDYGYSYGKYMSLMAPPQKPLEEVIAEENNRRCIYCGSTIPRYIKSDECCGSIACESARKEAISKNKTLAKSRQRRAARLKEEIVC